MPTGHPLDGMLEASGWWGKRFVDAETVHPLLFPTANGREMWAVNPILAFSSLGVATRIPALRARKHVGIVNLASPILGTREPKARLRTTRYRGVDTATMIYDQLPVNDVFRKLDDRTVIGAMDLRGSKKQYFFVLTRDNSLQLR